jgi:hypothetical protein
LDKVLKNTERREDRWKAFVEFLNGTLATWDRFTTEFDAEGAIAKVNVAQLSAAFALATNHISESALGVAKQVI